MLTPVANFLLLPNIATRRPTYVFLHEREALGVPSLPDPHEKRFLLSLVGVMGEGRGASSCMEEIRRARDHSGTGLGFSLFGGRGDYDGLFSLQ